MSLNSTLKTLSLASLLALGGFAFTPAALAGDCPAGQTAADAMKPGATMPKDVTDNVIGSIDLGNGYNIAGKTMRMRKLVVQPGGIVPWHSHTERPANIYVVDGAITEYRSTCKVPIEHKAGDIAVESGNLAHWWKNNTKKPATLISADIVPTPMMNEGGM
ncbi:MAG: cupin domain-containing protein [Micropepsaceae bacterium]